MSRNVIKSDAASYKIIDYGQAVKKLMKSNLFAGTSYINDLN